MTHYATLSRMVAALRIAAARATPYDGKGGLPPQSCCATLCCDPLVSREYLVRVIFTRDVGYHTAGWWKNPDYERCYHLSLSFVDAETGIDAEQQKDIARTIARGFYGDDIDKLWIEPPYSVEGKAKSVYHYRLFCNPAWETMLPRGEVYSTQFTELGWKSFSELHGGASCIHHGEEIKA